MTGTVLDEYQKFGVLLNLLDFRSLVVETFLALEDVSLLIRCLKKNQLINFGIGKCWGEDMTFSVEKSAVNTCFSTITFGFEFSEQG